MGSIVKQISEKLGNMAGHLVNIYCNKSRTHFEVYVTPDLTALYEVEGTYLLTSDVILRVNLSFLLLKHGMLQFISSSSKEMTMATFVFASSTEHLIALMTKLVGR